LLSRLPSAGRDPAGEVEVVMLYWALVFFVVALVAAVFGFGGIAATAAGIAKILFFVFLVLFAIALLTGLMRRRPIDRTLL
jgi:uncharacterized membrane protein YtjA (UPF0391 family)